MSMRRPLVFERERSALLTAIVEDAFAEALKQGMLFKLHEQETRMIFVRRVIRAIEAGESDIDRLKALALNPNGSELGMKPRSDEGAITSAKRAGGLGRRRRGSNERTVALRRFG